MSTLLAPDAFMRALTPRYLPMPHMAPLFSVFERIAAGEPVRVVTSVPPRFGKTELIVHSLVWLLLQNPELQIMFGSYAQRLAESKSRRARGLAAAAGVPLAQDSRARATWGTGVGQGQFWAMGHGGSATGEGAHVLVVDDPHKGRAEAESATIRESVYQWFRADLLTRLEPDGSVLVNQTRWHQEDLAGRLIAEGWEHINLAALTPAGESLWPERWPTETLLKKQTELGGAKGLEWLSLYMGTPPARGTRVFHDSHVYDEQPASFERICVGLDFAYSEKTSADWSVAVVLGLSAGKFYVLDVVRERVEPRAFRSHVQAVIASYPTATACAYAAATERGGIEFMRDGGIPIDGRTALIDKFSRAIPTVAAWNTGQILIPRAALWADAFVSEIASFTGTKADRHDDQVDALAAAFDGLTGGPQWQSPDWDYMSALGDAALQSWGSGYGNMGGW